MAHHPSIAVWSGCNECGGIGPLADVVAQEDQSRSIRAASPSLGYQSGVHMLTDHPTGRGPLVQRHSGPPSTQGLPWHIGESHWPVKALFPRPIPPSFPNLLEPASGVWVLECGVLTSREA